MATEPANTAGPAEVQATAEHAGSELQLFFRHMRVRRLRGLVQPAAAQATDADVEETAKRLPTLLSA